MKKTIFIFIDGYLPAKKYGGPVTSLYNLTENLGDIYDIRIITNNHDFNETAILEGIHDGWNEVGKANVMYVCESDYSTQSFKKILGEFTVDFIYLSGVFSHQMNFPAIRAAKVLNIPILLAPRGEICANALSLGKMKKSLFLIALRLSGLMRGVYFHATSDEELHSVQKILKRSIDKVFLLPNMHGVKTIAENDQKEKGCLKIVFISRVQQKKNLLQAIEAVSQMKGKVHFDIYGPLEQVEYWEKCKKAIPKNSDNISIKYCGIINPGETKKVFTKYDCFFFPTLSENYGHVIVEAMLARCPVILSKNTTPWDDMDGNGGFVIDLNNKQGFVQILNEMVAMDSQQFNVLREKIEEYAETKLKTSELVQEYIHMFDKVSSYRI